VREDTIGEYQLDTHSSTYCVPTLYWGYH